MKLSYSYNNNLIKIEETPNNADIEFNIHLLEEKNIKAIKAVKELFEGNDIFTDVLFYVYENHHYRVIVRPDYYVDFILQLMKHQLVNSVEWA
ncbi:hypothetical protein [Paenibacillus nasutitermitis]|uniref:Uncharacterized protein n=1 Tax=Paenibacillus nasutitermitis TaxID=1652958 RepID=A0A917DRH2_9BACL|nr:hypothetical protein [Paenibacillus nasutitermitis]GGD62990.1 hypothetical protein GCM10010911_20970 [Paenibacillus nasutitermitis]